MPRIRVRRIRRHQGRRGRAPSGEYGARTLQGQLRESLAWSLDRGVRLHSIRRHSMGASSASALLRMGKGAKGLQYERRRETLKREADGCVPCVAHSTLHDHHLPERTSLGTPLSSRLRFCVSSSVEQNPSNSRNVPRTSLFAAMGGGVHASLHCRSHRPCSGFARCQNVHS